ncbi:CtsR family transcriptional regulator [Natranaerobius thermophilus]|uniref:Transcriptional repressor, CtsR n=1 Tax=Natranaerobius thermophilus (strain ATCC BAA-1301 / DSM 18059 / JW/NM-WN-LF) TaxID=457570 RepID=B2A488_NATTJ|nr:CtsR family transcriptional regulator [Natranaerobius thermophilus]ACB83742.1 transcriptional repressor, CtsR [Natranaerobius thermophilus JW/NM-WN-LF]
MGSLSDNIEKYLKNLIEESPNKAIVVKRCDLAYKFNCVPSQINYVLSTRFTEDKGYLVSSRRGGGGYIEIRRLRLAGETPLYKLTDLIGNSISEQEANGLITRLADEGIIKEREEGLLKSCVKRESIPVPLPWRDEIRAALFKNVLLEILKFKE